MVWYGIIKDYCRAPQELAILLEGEPAGGILAASRNGGIRNWQHTSTTGGLYRSYLLRVGKVRKQLSLPKQPEALLHTLSERSFHKVKLTFDWIGFLIGRFVLSTWGGGGFRVRNFLMAEVHICMIYIVTILLLLDLALPPPPIWRPRSRGDLGLVTKWNFFLQEKWVVSGWRAFFTF